MWVVFFSAVASMVAYTMSSSAQAYWQLADISLWGQLTTFLGAMSTLSFIWLVLLSIYLRDAKILTPHNDSAQRRLFCCTLCPPQKRGSALREGGAIEPLPFTLFPLRWTNVSQTELLFLLGLNNASASLLQWYCSPPSREPPLINGLVPCLQPIFAVPLAYYCLGDKRDFFRKSPLPLLATLCVILGVVVSVIPSQQQQQQQPSSGSESGENVILWTLVNVMSQAPSAMALVGCQAYLLRSGVMEESAGPWRRIVFVSRFVFFNQCGVAVLVFLCWWLDIIPWFGSGESVQGWWTGVQFSFKCTLGLEPHAPTTCPPYTPMWALLTVLPYGIYLGGISLVSASSAVFGNVLEVAQSALQTLFWLIPGTNPAPNATPLWSALTSSALTLLGVSLFRVWELRQPEGEMITLDGLQPCGDSAPWYAAPKGTTEDDVNTGLLLQEREVELRLN